MEGSIKTLLMAQGVTQGMNISPPMGLHRLKQYANDNGFSCEVLDIDIEDHEPYLKAVEQGEYQIIGMTVSHTEMASDLDYLWQFRNAAQKSGNPCLFIAGGQEATMNYKQWLEAGIELICLGFAEEAFVSVCEKWTNYLNNHPKNGSDYDLDQIFGQVNGVAYSNKDGGESAFRPIDSLTQETFSKFSYKQLLRTTMPYQKYWDKAKSERIDGFNNATFIYETARLYTSSHCPRRCGFCSSQTFIPFSQNGNNPIIMLSAEEMHHLIIDYCKRYNARGFLFSDDDFPIGSKPGLERLSKFCQMITQSKRENRIPKETKLFCQNRIADFLVWSKVEKKKSVRLSLLDEMATAGFHNLGFGVETFSNNLIGAPSINKLGVTVQDCRNVLEAVLERKMVPQLFLIAGIPESTVEDLVETMTVGFEFTKKGCDISVTPCMEAYPGSPFIERNNIKVNYKKWVNPYTGKKILIADSIVPNDPTIRKVVDNIIETSIAEIERIKKEANFTKDILPKSLVGMARFMAAAKIINRMDLHTTFNDYVFEVIAKDKNSALETTAACST